MSASTAQYTRRRRQVSDEIGTCDARSHSVRTFLLYIYPRQDAPRGAYKIEHVPRGPYTPRVTDDVQEIPAAYEEATESFLQPGATR